MTVEEYKNLYDDYYSTDSIKRKEEIHDLIYKEFMSLLVIMKDLYVKYDQFDKLVDNSDWRSNSGHYYLREDDICQEYVSLTYSDNWAYGGECCCGIVLYSKWLDAEVRKNTENTLKENYIKSLKCKITICDKKISTLQKEKTEFMIKLRELGVTTSELFYAQK